MGLFIVENLKVMPHPTTLLIHPFKQMWEDDDSEKKAIALLQFAYIEFMCSYEKSNVFIDYNKEIRGKKIIESITSSSNGFGEFWNTLLVDEGIKFYSDLQNEASPTVVYYEAAVQGADKLAKFFNDVDLTRVTRTGTPVYKPADVTRALKDSSEVMKTLNSMKETIHSELAEASKGKGGRTINFFEKALEER